MNEERYDGLKTYCRMLGHELGFSYCRKPGKETPCSKIRDCWFQKIPIDAFLQETLTEEQLETFLAPSGGKIHQILLAALAAKQRSA